MPSTRYPDLTAEMRHVLTQHTETDTLKRALTRTGIVLEAFYDDDPGDPEQALSDLLTDIFHEAAAREVDIDGAFERARRMFEMERAEWAVDRQLSAPE